MLQASHRSRRILRPANPRFIYATLILALLLHYLPIGRLPGVPDWMALTIAIWAVHEPRYAGMSMAFVFGLLTDIGFGAVMGQHALGYVLIGYGANTLSRRILWFSPLEQALHILPLLLLSQVAMVVLRVVAGDTFPGWSLFMGSFSATLLWWPVSLLLLLPQYRPEATDETRPL